MYCFYRDENDITRLTDLNSEIVNNQALNIIGGRRGRARRSSPRRSSTPSARSMSPTSRFVTYFSTPVYYYRPLVFSYLAKKYKTKYEVFVEKLSTARGHYMSAVNSLTPVANVINTGAMVGNLNVQLNNVQVTHNGVATTINSASFSKQYNLPHITVNLANGVNNAHLATISINAVAVGGIDLNMIANFNNHMNLCRSVLASLEPLDPANMTTVLIDDDRANQYRIIANNFPYYTVFRKDGVGANEVRHILEIQLVKMY